VALVTEWLEGLGTLPPAVLYLVLAALVLAETGMIVGLFLPGEPVLLFAGFLISVGTLDLFPTVAVLAVAALAGDSLAYLIGRRYGPRLRGSRLGRRIGPRRWDRADRLLVRYGGRAVLFGRWVAFARTLVPALAGMSRFPYRRFLAWDVVAVLTYVPASVLLGYAAGRSYLELERSLGRATGAVTLLAVGVAALVMAGRWLGRHPDPAHALGGYFSRSAAVRWAGTGQRRVSSRLGDAGAGAVNLAFGLAAMLLLGWLVAELAQRVVRTSGLPLVDGPISRWVAARADPEVADAAQVVVDSARAGVALAIVGLLALVPTVRARRRGERGWYAPVGAVVSLIILGLAVSWAVPAAAPPPGHQPDTHFPTEHAIVTAGVWLLAWLAARRSSWSRAVAAWTAAMIVVLLVTTARLYVGGNWPSEATASVLLGAVWVTLLIAMWRSWERLPEPEPATAERDTESRREPVTQ
jgi:undecaprenyl-diphosphatase